MKPLTSIIVGEWILPCCLWISCFFFFFRSYTSLMKPENMTSNKVYLFLSNFEDYQILFNQSHLQDSLKIKHSWQEVDVLCWKYISNIFGVFSYMNRIQRLKKTIMQWKYLTDVYFFILPWFSRILVAVILMTSCKVQWMQWICWRWKAFTKGSHCL